MSTTRSRAVRKNRKSQLALAGAAVLGVAAIGISAAGHILADTRTYDPGTLCVIGSDPAEHVAVLVDHTDPYSPVQQQIFSEAMEQVSASLAVGGRISVHVLSDQPEQASIPLFDMCKPADGSGANPVYQNAGLELRRYNEGFAGPIEELASRLKTGASAETSPILEAAAEAGLSVGRNAPLRIVIISDLLQNSPLGSVYTRTLSPSGLEAAPGLLMIRRGLSGARVDVVVLPSASHAHLQTEALTGFWRTALRASGASVGAGLDEKEPT